MDAKLKNEWIKALRSGEYQQTRGALSNSVEGHLDSKDATAFCCLGVGCLVKSKLDNIPVRNLFKNYGSIEALELDYPMREGDDDSVGWKLVLMNDIKKLSFIEIADWIEKNVKVDDAKET